MAHLSRQRLLVLVLVGVCVLTGFGESVRAQDPAKIQITATQVTGGIFVLSGAVANIGVSVGEDGVLLVDDGVVPALDKVKSALAAIDPRAPRIVLNTNWHFDHAEGNEAFAAQGAVVMAHPRSRPHMLVEQRITELDPVLVVQPYRRGALPIVAIDEPTTLLFNGDDIATIHVPMAHSDADLAYYFRKANVLFTGDLFFPAGSFFIHFSGGGTLTGMIRAADQLIAVTNEHTRIVPGHGPVSTRSDLAATREFLVAIRDRIRGLLARGQNREQIVAADPLKDLFKGRQGVPTSVWARLIFDELAAAEGAGRGATLRFAPRRPADR
jgi:cyclase